TWSINYGDGTSSPYVSASTISKTYNKAGTYTALANGRDATGKIATSNPVVLTITQSTSTLTVKTVNAASNAINGYYTTLWQNGALVKSAYSPTSFTFKNGQTYQLSLADYGGYAFDHWNDGSTIRQMTVTLKESKRIASIVSQGQLV